MSLDADAIKLITAAAMLALIPLVRLRIRAHGKRRKSNEAIAHEAELIERKLITYRLLVLEHPDEDPLLALRELKLEELGSDQSIRAALGRMQELSGVDPWGGKAAVVEDVNLKSFFSHVTRNRTNLAGADLPALARKVRAAGGARYPLVLYRRPSKKQLAVASASIGVLLVAVLVRTLAPDRGPHPLPGGAKGPDTPSPAGPREPQAPKASRQNSSGSSNITGSNSDAGAPGQAVDPERAREAQALERRNQVARQVTDTRNLMSVMNDSITRMNYAYAISGLRKARLAMEGLQSHFTEDPPPELQEIIDDLDIQIAEAERTCRNKAEIEKGNKVQITCPSN